MKAFDFHFDDMVKFIQQCRVFSDGLCASSAFFITDDLELREFSLPLVGNPIIIAGGDASPFSQLLRIPHQEIKKLGLIVAKLKALNQIEFIRNQYVGMGIEQGAKHTVPAPSRAQKHAVSFNVLEVLPLGGTEDMSAEVIPGLGKPMVDFSPGFFS